MALYFLRLRDGDTLLPDDGEGEEFASLDEVRSDAIESARQILSAAVLNGTAASLNQQIEVVDVRGNARQDDLDRAHRPRCRHRDPALTHVDERAI
jgi:Domain of unknown function (DUF6894)